LYPEPSPSNKVWQIFFNKKINLKDGQIYQMPASPNPQLLALIGFTSAIKPGVKPNPTLKLTT